MLGGFHKKRIQTIRRVGYIIFAAILLKLSYAQTVSQTDLMAKAKDLWERSFPIAAERGKIIDRNNQVLAMNLPSVSVMVVPSQIEDKEYAADFLSAVLGADRTQILEKISKHVSTQKLNPEGRLITSQQESAIVKENLKGVYLIRDAKRYYPNDSYLAQVLGFTGIDNQGLSGLELKYDDVLMGKSGSLNIPFDAKGNKIDLMEENWTSSGMGNDLMLTIDGKIQDIIERELNNAMLKYSPQQAWALAMNPNTGEILAMVSKPDFDPNNYQDYPEDIYNRNLPIFNSYEPGSTFKVVTFATALEEKVIDMEKDKYMDIGYEMVGGARLKSWKAGGHGLQTFLEVLQNSSNPGFVEIARRLGTDRLYDNIINFGFGSKTGIDLVGESTGIMFTRERMGPVETATTAFGQGISLTALQLVSAVSSIVNGGYYYQPYITKAILHPITHDILYEKEPVMVRRTVSEETSMQMRYALENVIAKGGGRQAYIEGYQIGGKTGTAQKAKNGVYMTSEYILSFIGVAPIDDPQIVIYMALDNPRNGIQYGGTVVAPIVRACLEDILPYLEVKRVEEQIPRTYLWGDAQKYKVDDYLGLEKKQVKSSRFKFVYAGEGSKVVSQMPAGGTYLEEGKTIWLLLEDDEVQ